NDPAGHLAVRRLAEQAIARDIETIVLAPALGDFNDDLRRFGVPTLTARLRAQVAPEDVRRLLDP
ncbi:hypothetical protein, partial [Klebsiella pneumoniae]|uniref:hypothetical protein n=1 Tax=Klebsiella pneumoniae TaxID=573 RepID=UPI001954589C